MPTDEIRGRVEAFTADLAVIIKNAALEAVHEALGGGAAPRAQAAAKRGRSAKNSGAPKKAAPAQARAKKRGPGEKRDPAVLAKLVETLVGYIKAHPGERIEPIGKALSVPTKDLALPVKKLLAAKRISSKRQKRATTYFPNSGGLVQVKKAKKPAEAAAK
jgi:hypothetical protein